MSRTSFDRVSRLERRCLAAECYTSKEAYDSTSDDERAEYVDWLERQCGEFFSAIN